MNFEQLDGFFHALVLGPDMMMPSEYLKELWGEGPVFDDSEDAWLHENPQLRFLPIEEVNSPALISRNRKMVSINGALAVDLLGQVVADTLAGQQFSGIGGHQDFCAGAAHAPGGHSLVCLPSTASAGGAQLSRIIASVPAGSAVTTPRHEVDIVITEHGAAELAGKTVAERAEALIAIADPAFRPQLSDAWARASC